MNAEQKALEHRISDALQSVLEYRGYSCFERNVLYIPGRREDFPYTEIDFMARYADSVCVYEIKQSHSHHSKRKAIKQLLRAREAVLRYDPETSVRMFYVYGKGKAFRLEWIKNYSRR